MRAIMTRTGALALAFVALSTTGCGKKPAGTYDVASSTGDAANFAQLKTDAEALWAERSDKDKLAEALAKFEKAYEANPRDREVAARLVRGWYFMGDALRTDPDQKNEAFDKAISWGKRCLAINEDFTARLNKGTEKEEDVVDALGKEDVPCMYWTASATGKWAKLNGILTSLKHLGTVKAYMGRIGELDPGYYYHGPDRYWGAYYSLIPSFSGRDLDKARKHFNVSIAASPDYLGTQVLLADAWAVNSQDRETYKAVLDKVLLADPEVIPEIAPENRAEQAKAKQLLAEIDDRFAN